MVSDGGNMITLNDRSKPMYFQIYMQLKEQIQSGKIKAGEKLLSKRKMAESLDVSVNTVEGAYSQLLSEGFIESVPKSGYYVCQIDKLNFVGKRKLSEPQIGSNKGKDSVKINFSTDGVDSVNFPYNTWRRLMKNCFNEYNPSILKSFPPEGSLELRKAVASHIYRSRGVNCRAEQVIIGAGVDNLISMISGLLGTDFLIAMEEPVYYEAYSYFKVLDGLCSNHTLVLYILFFYFLLNCSIFYLLQLPCHTYL